MQCTSYVVGVHTNKGKHTKMSSAIIQSNSFAPSMATQIFTHGPRNTNRNDVDYEEVKKLSNIIKIYVHEPYTVHIFKGDDRMFELMLDVFRAANSCGSSGVVIHLPRATVSVVVTNVCRLLVMLTEEQIHVPIILETPSNKPHPTMSWESPEKLTLLCSAFRAKGVSSAQVGICIDTAHVYAGGAQIATRKDVTAYLKALPIEWVHLFHLNGNEYEYPKSGDKHAIPLSPLDAIWRGKKYEESGCYEFIEWARGFRIPTLFEGKDSHSSEDIFTFIQMCGRM
jgi:endonuclease IV